MLIAFIIVQSLSARKACIFSLPFAMRNSPKVIGYRYISSTFPTGYEIPSWSAIPKRLPQAATWYSEASSAIAFKRVNAIGQSCISSRITSVSPGIMSTPVIADNPLRIFSADISVFISWHAASSRSKLMKAVFLYLRLPNSFSSQVFPTCLAPNNTSGFLFFEELHFTKSLYKYLSIVLILRGLLYCTTFI